MTRKILLVEDDQILREMYHLWLTKEGYEVETSKDGNEAMGRILNEDWAIVILDIMLPGKDGLTILKEVSLQVDQKSKKVPILLITNLARDQIIKEAVSHGAVDCILKTELKQKQLLEIVRKHAILS